jgi:sulfotransferase family protein
MSRDFTFRDARPRSPAVLALNALGRISGFPWSWCDPDALVESARRATRLEDLGTPDYREALEAYCESLPRESKLTAFGRLGARGGVVGALANRLRVLDWARRHPEVHEERIERPWIIIGLPRTGTSLLSFLMELDPHSRTPTQWEALAPIPPPQIATHTSDPRIAVASRQLAKLTRLCPPLNALHPMDAGLAAEDVSILMYSLRSFQFETLAFTPGYGRWLDAADMRPAYALFRLVLQIWQSTIPTSAWSLKCPQHLGNLDALLDVFPDARIVWIHRDPARALPSVASMANAYMLMGSRGLDPVRVAGYWADRLARSVDRAMAYDERAQRRDWCCHVHYDSLLKDPAGTVRTVRAHFGAGLDPLHERRIERFMRDRPQDLYGRHVYRLEDFGMTLGAIDARFAPYTQRYGVGFEGR